MEWYTLKQAAEIAGKEKKVIEYHAGKLDADDKRKDPETGFILISSDALDRMRQKFRTGTLQVPKKYPESTKEPPEKYPTGTKQHNNSDTQQVPEKALSGTQQVPNSSTETVAFDVLKATINDLKSELTEIKAELATVREDLTEAKTAAAAARAELDAEKRCIDILKQQIATKDEQIAAEHALHAGTISKQKQLETAVEIPTGNQPGDDQSDGDSKPGFIARHFARLFRRKKED